MGRLTHSQKIKQLEKRVSDLEKQTPEVEQPNATPSDEVAVATTVYFGDVDWDSKEKILINDTPEKKVFVNNSFADKSIFGKDCVFIDCKFGSCCEFGSYCEFGLGCEFGSYCEKAEPYWDERGKHE